MGSNCDPVKCDPSSLIIENPERVSLFGSHCDPVKCDPSSLIIENPERVSLFGLHCDPVICEPSSLTIEKLKGYHSWDHIVILRNVIPALKILRGY